MNQGRIMVRSIYRDIYRELCEGIESGTYAFQTQIPTEDALCARFSCSHSTVRRALQELARAGYVQARQGSGVTVIWQPTPQDANGYATGGIEIFPEVCAERGLAPATELRYRVCQCMAAKDARCVRWNHWEKTILPNWLDWSR